MSVFFHISFPTFCAQLSVFLCYVSHTHNNKPTKTTLHHPRTMSPSLPYDMGGLSHLVEAATALTELVGRPVISVPQPQATKRSESSTATAATVITDDDNAKRNSKKKEIFPQKLVEILSDSSLSDVVSWLPHGRSFVIIRPDLFCEQVLPKYLPPVDSRGSTKYPSFTRKLNRW